MRKKLISYSIITFILFGGVLFLKNQTKIESNFTLRAAEQPEGVSSISFALPNTSTYAYNSDGTHRNSELTLDNVVNGSNDLITGYSGIAAVFPGNQPESGGYGASSTTLKFGSSKAVGTMTIAAKYSVHKVVINYATWSATKNSQLKVNGVSGQEVARLTFADETFDLSTPSTTVTIETTFPSSGDRRVGIARIDLYHRCGL